MNVAVGARSDVGRVREGNEDSYLINEPLFVVADGMGGHLAGDVASSTAVEIISSRSDTASAEDPQTLADLIRRANSAIWEKAHDDPMLRGMGTTCTLVLLDGNRAHIAHVGDSRAYVLHDGRLQQVTEDHTLVARMVKEGRLQAEDAERHPQRSIITRALGVDADVEVDLDTLDLTSGDRLLLCSDGLSSMIDHDSIESALRDHADPQDAADELVRRANAAGGEDNITVVVIDANGRSPQKRPAVPARATGDPAEDTEPAEAVTPERRRWVKPLVLSLLGVGLLVAGAFFLVQHLRTNYWYVGLNANDKVTIFQGRPEDLFGIDLDETAEVSGISLEDLPDHLRDNVEDGRTADSREDAEQIVSDLEQRVRDFEKIKSQDAADDSPGTGDGGDAGDNAGTKTNDSKNN